jgi:hypothetical protein
MGWSLNTLRCSTTVSGVMQRLATEHLLIALLSSMPPGNYLQHNPQLARPLNRIVH